MFDFNIHKVMNYLCLRAGKKVRSKEHWVNHSCGISVCLLCDQTIADSEIGLSAYLELRDKHALQHLKDHNLLPFI